MSIYGIFFTSASRIFRPTFSSRKSIYPQISELFSVSKSFLEYSSNFSETGRIINCSGASHNGNWPPQCSIKTATKRSNDPKVLYESLRSEEHTSELQSLMRISYAVFCLKKKIITNHTKIPHHSTIRKTHNT